MRRDELEREQFIDDVNDGNACGTGVSCNLDNCERSKFAYFSHWFKLRCDVVAKQCAPCAGIVPSTLP
jgi:hypothetical protein